MNLFTSSSNDKKAEFQEVLTRYGDIAYRMALHLTGGKEDESREIVQEAFVRLWKRWDGDRPRSYQSWLYRVLHNLYMDALRRRVRQVSFTALEGDDPAEDGACLSGRQAWEDQVPSSAPMPGEEALVHERQAAVTAALEQLPVGFRVPVVLCDMEGLSYDEIAAILNVPVGTIRSRIHRGREHLRRLLRPFEEEGRVNIL